MSLKVLNFISGKDLGGSKQVFLDYVQMCLELGFDTYTLIRPTAQIKEHLKKIHPYPEKQFEVSYLRSQWPFLRQLALYQIKKALKDISVQLVFVHKPIDLFFMKKIFPKALVVAIVHGFKADYLEQADKILCVSHAVKNYLVERQVKQPIYVLPNSVNLKDIPLKEPGRNIHTPKIPPNSKNIDSQQVGNSPKKVLTIGSMCKFRRKKNVHLLLKAFSALKKQKIPFQGLIAGEGRQRMVIEYYQRLYGLHDCVQILPWVDCKESFYDSVDIYCVTSLSETFNLTLIEAMARKKPVVSTDCGGPSDIITSGQDGFLVPNNCEDSLTEMLKRLLLEPSLRKTLSVQGEKKVHRLFTQKVVLKQLKNLIEKDWSLQILPHQEVLSKDD